MNFLTQGVIQDYSHIISGVCSIREAVLEKAVKNCAENGWPSSKSHAKLIAGPILQKQEKMKDTEGKSLCSAA
jgi:hypothetical protein